MTSTDTGTEPEYLKSSRTSEKSHVKDYHFCSLFFLSWGMPHMAQEYVLSSNIFSILTQALDSVPLD
jgi:hypothetical protein